MTPKHKSFPALRVKTLDKEQGILEAIVSVFTVLDCYDERIHPGFFTKSLETKYPKGVWMHDWTIPVAKTLEAKELLPGDELLPDELKDLGGLYIKGQFNLDTQRGRESFSDIDFGIIDEFSIGFYPTNEKYDPKTGITELYEGTLVEWSPVLLGANPATTVISTKSALSRKTRELHQDGQIATEIALFGDKTPFSTKETAQIAVKFKGAMLGENVEKCAAYYAISDIWYSLNWVLWEQIFSSGPLDERISNITAAFDEFRDVSLRIITALVNDVDDASEGELAELQAAYKSVFLQQPNVKALLETALDLVPAVETITPAFNAAKSKATQRLKLTQMRAQV